MYIFVTPVQDIYLKCLNKNGYAATQLLKEPQGRLHKPTRLHTSSLPGLRAAQITLLLSSASLLLS